MMAGNSVVVRRRHQPFAVDHHLADPGDYRDKRHAVVVMVLVTDFLNRAIILHPPVQHLLASGRFGSQPQALQPMRDRLRKFIPGGVGNFQAHQA